MSEKHPVECDCEKCGRALSEGKCPWCGELLLEGYGLAGGGIGHWSSCNSCDYFYKVQDTSVDG